MSEQPPPEQVAQQRAENFRALTPEQQHYARLHDFQREAKRLNALDSALVANMLANRHKEFVPTPEAVAKIVAEFAFCNADLFRSVPDTYLQAAANLNDARRLAQESNVRHEHVEEVAQLIAGVPNRLAVLGELRQHQPHLFGEDTRTLTPQEAGKLSPTEYRRTRAANPERLGLRRNY